MHFSVKFIRNVKSRIYCLPVHVHKHQLYLLEQNSESLKVRSAIMKFYPGNLVKLIT